jgi:hypothetical protein
MSLKIKLDACRRRMERLIRLERVSCLDIWSVGSGSLVVWLASLLQIANRSLTLKDVEKVLNL